MSEFIGTKVVYASPMNRFDYNVFRGWDLPTNENGSDEGYLVEYTDGGEPNTTTHKGYVSWSPKEQFDNAYRESGNLSFGDAIVYMKKGYKVARSGWNGKNMYIVLMEGYPMTLANTITREKHGLPEGSHVTVEPYIVMKSTQLGSLQPGWLASQADMLAEDWGIV